MTHDKWSSYLAAATMLLGIGGCTSSHTKMEQAVSANVTQNVESQYTGPKRRVGVVDFVNKTAYGQNRVGGAAADILVTELTKTGKFILIERDKLNKVLQEQKAGQTGAIDSDTAAQMGQMLGLNAIVLGTISNFGMNEKGSDFVLGQRKSQTATVTVDVRVVDAETGRILYADSGQGESTLTTGEFLGVGTKAGYEEKLEGDALRAAISQFAANITSRINQEEWSCRVAQVQGDQIYLDAGKESGLEIGQKFKVYHLGAAIKSPQSGLVIGRTQEFAGEVRLADFFGDNGSIAKMVRGSPPTAGDLVKLAE